MKQTGSSNLAVAAVVALAAVIVVGVFFFQSEPEPQAVAPVNIPGAATTGDSFGQARGPGFGTADRATAAGAASDAEVAAPDVRRNVEAESMRKQRPAGSAPPRPAGEADLDDDPEDFPSLRRVALEDADPERRLTAVTLLGISENAEAVPVLAEALNDEDEEVRMEAVLALADFTDEAPVAAMLSQALSDPSAEIRYEALDVLSDIETAEAKAAVTKALDDPDEDVRELAEIILEMWIDE